MAINLFIIFSFILNMQSGMAAADICLNAGPYFSALQKNDGHVDSLKKIKALKNEFNTKLAEETVSAGVKKLNDKYLNEYDYSSALILEMVVALVANPNANSFEDLCKDNISKIKLCSLPEDKRKNINATFSNLKTACALSICSENSEVKKIDAQKLKEFVEAQKNENTLSNKTIIGLSPTASDALAESPERQKIKADIEAIQTSSFKDIETMKRFVGEKYLRSCSYNAPVTEILSSCGLSGVPQIINLDIKDDTFDIIGELVKQSGPSSTFSKSEIIGYKQVCDRNKGKSGFDITCLAVEQEYNKAKNVKEPKDWEEIRKKNYVDIDSDGQVRITPKISNTELFLGAAAPAFASFAPFWSYNMQQMSQINIMAQQTMLYRQYGYYNYNTNPYGYFQGNYLPVVPPTSPGYNFSL